MTSVHRSPTVGDQPNAYRYSRLSSRPPEFGRGDSPYHRRLETVRSSLIHRELSLNRIPQLRKRGGRQSEQLDSKDDAMVELLVSIQSPSSLTPLVLVRWAFPQPTSFALGCRKPVSYDHCIDKCGVEIRRSLDAMCDGYERTRRSQD